MILGPGRRALASPRRIAGLILAGVVAATSGPEPVAAQPAESDSLPQPRNREGPRGRWRKIDAPQLSAEQQAQLEQLRSIGYVGGSISEGRSGVTIWDPDRTGYGRCFYTSGHAAEAILMEMDGEIVHRWSYDFHRIWPDSPDLNRRMAMWWRRAHVFENGDLLAIFEGLGAIRLDRDSNLLWSTELAAHHDLEVLPDGSWWMLTREPRIIPEVHERALTLEDFITHFNPEGEPIRSWSVHEALRDSPWSEALEHGRHRQGDVFHTNTLHVVPRIDAQPELFPAGHVLTALNSLGLIAVWDLESNRITWATQDAPHGHHDPRLLPRGTVLVFENGRNTKASRVVERDAATWEPVWEYVGTEAQPFYSETCGTSERLPDGNTLITESDGGRAFEVTPDGEIVWEFFNPERAGEEGEFIATISEMVRLPADFGDAWLPEP